MSDVSRRSLFAAGLAAAVSVPAARAAAPAESTERALRRKDYELTEAEARYVIEHTDHAVLGTADASGTPYAVPVTPFLFGGQIYFHGTKNELSRKRVNIQQNSQVSLAWIGTSPIKEDEYTVKYVSAVVAGRARIVSDPTEKQRIFEAFVNRFVPSRPLDEAKKVIAESIADADVFEVTIEKISGKAKTRHPFFGTASHSGK